MKLTLEQHGETYTIQTQPDDQTASDMLQYVYQLMLCAGYAKKIVDEAILDFADDIGAEEGMCMQPNPTNVEKSSENYMQFTSQEEIPELWKKIDSKTE